MKAVCTIVVCLGPRWGYGYLAMDTLRPLNRQGSISSEPAKSPVSEGRIDPLNELAPSLIGRINLRFAHNRLGVFLGRPTVGIQVGLLSRGGNHTRHSPLGIRPAQLREQGSSNIFNGVGHRKASCNLSVGRNESPCEWKLVFLPIGRRDSGFAFIVRSAIWMRLRFSED